LATSITAALKLKFAGNSIGFSCRRGSGDAVDCSGVILLGGPGRVRNGDQVVGDQVEHEIGCNATDDAMFCFAHCAILLAPTEDAFDHRPARLRHAIALAARGPFVDGAPAALASFGDAVVLRHMRRDDEGTKIAAVS
jgi:hypothetical protein